MFANLHYAIMEKAGVQYDLSNNSSLIKFDPKYTSTLRSISISQPFQIPPPPDIQRQPPKIPRRIERKSLLRVDQLNSVRTVSSFFSTVPPFYVFPFSVKFPSPNEREAFHELSKVETLDPSRGRNF